MKNSHKWPRILVALAALLLIGAIFFPLWQIQLSAPQYPEGLMLTIHANGLGGNVDVVNGLNHYIGMNTLHTEDFIEFKILPYIIGTLVILGLITALVNRKSIYYGYIALFLLVAIVSMIDFYRWEYNYGHDLDPNAAIQVPGMSYQPPLIGYKQLLNFGAYSIPDIGGWLFIASGVLLVAAFIILIRANKILKKKVRVVSAICLLFAVHGCTAKPQPVKYGSDACNFCKMTIMDKKFACEWITGKGKVFRFDDLHCLLSYNKANYTEGKAYVNDYTGNGELLPANDLFYINAAAIKAPMGGNLAAFSNQIEAANFSRDNQGKLLSWTDVKNTLIK
ncbi:MAG: nitrous oxide reductase accessory protein NosL [Bacteroidota bacterium]